MRNAFEYGGRSSSEFGVYISGGGIYAAPERDVEFVSIPGRSGDLMLDNGRFKNINITYPAFIPDRFRDRWDSFKAHMLKTPAYQRLADTYDTAHYRMAVYLGDTAPEVVALHRAASFEIEFQCKPQRWLTAGEIPLTYREGATIYNPTMYPSKPLIEVTGYGQVLIGDYRFTIPQHTRNLVYIDCDLQDCYYGQSNMNDLVTFDGGVFPEIVPGSVAITFSSTIQSVVITPRWWTV